MEPVSISYRGIGISRLHKLLVFTLPISMSIREFSSGKVSVANKTHNVFGKKSEKSKLILTPRIVHSTLLSCPSDIIAISFFLWCAKQPNYFHDGRAFEHIVGVVKRITKRFRTVREIVKELESVGCVTKAQTFLLLLRIYWRGEMYEMVFETFDQMGSCGFTPNTFARNVIIDVLLKIGCIDAAIKVLKETQFPNFLTFNIAICNLCRLNDMSNIKDVIRTMLREGFYPNVETFEMVLNCFCKAGRLVEAYQVLALMISLGISDSMIVWSILINGYCRTGRVGMAGCLLEKMVEIGYSPNVVTYTILIKGFMESQMFSSACDILNSMESKGCAPDLVLCNVFIDCLSKVGKYDDALDVFLGFSKRNMVPDSYTFCSLLSTICLSRRFFLFPKLVSRLVIEVDLVACNSLLSYLCKAGFPSLAVEFYTDMLDKGCIPDKYSFTGLLSALCAARRIDEAVNVYNGIIMNSCGLDAHVHTAVISGLIKAGQFHKAIKVFRTAVIEKYPLDVISYTFAIDGLLRGGRTEEAFTLYNQMKENGLIPNVHTYNVMISGFIKERDIKMVKHLLQEMIDARIKLSCNNFFRITKYLCGAPHCHSTFDVFIEMRHLGLISAKAMISLSFDGLDQSVDVGEEHNLFVKGYSEDNLSTDMSSSEDLAIVAASVG